MTDVYSTTWADLDAANKADGHYATREPVALRVAQQGIETLEDRKAIAVDDGDTLLANEINQAQAYLEGWKSAVYDSWQKRIAATFGECGCVLPEMSCPACEAAAVRVYGGAL